MILVVLSLFLLAGFSFLSLADVSGCYVYPEASEDLYCQAGILDTEAQVDCEFYDSCNLEEHFIPASDCSELDECEEIICNVDCQTHALGICTQLGGTAVPDEEYDARCSPGCCKIVGKDFCKYNLFKFECDDKAKKLGSSEPPIFRIDVDLNECNIGVCQVELKKASLTILVQDEQQKPISGAEITLTTTIKQTTSTSGKTTFANINSGTYSLTVTATDYASGSLVVSLSSGEEAEQTIIIKKVENIAALEGTVTDSSGILKGATVSWTGPVSGQTSTDEQGKYNTGQLPQGDYSFTASKVGFKSKVEKYPVNTKGTFPLNFELTPVEALGISGKVFIDSNNNKEIDSDDQVVYGATFYLDGVFKGYSVFPEGSFNIEVEVISVTGKETHNLSAVYQNYQFEEEFVFEKGISLTNQNLLLTTYIGECTEPGTELPVEEFTVIPLPGEEVLKIEWTKPCPEVIGYKVIKTHEGVEIEPLSASPAESFILDHDVKWGQSYTYKIIAYYDKNRETVSEIEATMNVGDKRCESKYSETEGWDLFCLVGDKPTRKTIWSCDNFNQLNPVQNCGGDPALNEDYYCAQTTESSASCQNAGNCGASPQQADPFGLYYDRQKCYGTGSPEEGTTNYCYFDFTDTIFNECKDCTKIDNCFDYQSKDACEINNCLGTKCDWLDDAKNTELVDYSLINLPVFTTPETGTGYCVEEGYEENLLDPEGDDYCSSCNPLANLFENNFCTAEVCSGLGRCFSAFNLAQCSSCGEFPNTESNCYAYNTELECAGQQNLQRDPYGEIINSNDECGWNKCLWTGASNGYSENGCVKDGNGDGTSDCESFSSATDQKNCKLDNSAPKTKILPEGINVISFATPEIFFMANDIHNYFNQENFLGTASYCLTSTTFDSCFDKDVQQAFTEVSYPGKALTESITLNLINSSFLQGKKINGETYRLKYYSEDKYFNQESVQETFVYIDNVVPEFEINENINTIEDITTLSVYLTGTKEIMSCTFTLNQILPLGGKKVIAVPREEEIKNALFENLKGVKFDLDVTCIDDAGNENSKVKNYIFDLEERIDIINPEMESAVSETEISFKVNTVAGASCGLYLTANNEKVADFISDQEGKEHQTESLLGFFEKEYVGEYKVVCNELLDQTETYEDYFNFVIDFSSPETQIILKEGSREEKPTPFGWEEFFIETVTIDFACSATGFSCDKTYYCLGDNCQANFFTAEKSNYQEYTASLELLESSTICYYSTDLANNPVYQPLCGKVLIEGYGITLENPEQHFYQEEQWGISNQPVFTFQFFTKVPTTECRIDFSPEFDYDALPVHKNKEINADKKYLFDNFPESIFTSYPDSCSGDDSSCVKTVYVKCKDLDGKIGPETKIFLEYDSTAPEITAAFADPDEIFEGVTTELFVDTDDKTLCKFSDDSEGAGSQEYGNMEYSFPGTIDKILNLNHQEIFNINFIGPTKQYSLYTQCTNGAADLSLTEQINFSVDYSQAGYILENTLLPSAYIWGQNITISVGTSKNAFCKYDFNSEGYKPFINPENQQIHTADISISEEGQYIIPVKCVMGDHTISGEIKFTYDLTAPTVTNIEDGNLTCGREEINLIVNTDEINDIGGYVYQVYNQGKDFEVVKKEEQKKSKLAALANFAAKIENNKSVKKEINKTVSAPKAVNPGKVGAMVLNGEAGPESPLKIPTAELILGNYYTVKVKVIDGAGNEGEFYESDGIAVVNQSYFACQEKKAPEVTFTLNNSLCTSTMVEMTCQDNSGCDNFLYGKSGTKELCNTTEIYTGKKITFNTNGWICYSVSDYQNETHKDSKQISFDDTDGDKVLDSCDQCPETATGKIVNDLGCADNEVSEEEIKEDSDGDSLPDKWEKSYAAFDCLLDYTNQDSDDNGVIDSEEDYDLDTINNYQEYLFGNNPCLADAPLTDLTEEPSAPYSPPTLPAGGDNTLATIFLLLGIMMVFGGIGYLVYYYIYSPAGKTVARPVSTVRRAVPGVRVAKTKPKILSDWKNKLLQLKKSRTEKLKQRQRQGVFGKFSPQSQKIPHLERFIQKKNPDLSHLQSMAHKYSQHKKEIKPGLKSGEKSIFNKLESIAKQTKDKKIHQVVNKTEAKDIFSKLKTISKKRKGK
ncbi:carboxypeptidase regulatory-like domain-containing protein [Candidatus Woesearchaeota archaeon]|nr:carboxypeptidase regulatory-like domain-containing protein [Candidatus Woesearchaeota archaeon]